MTHSTQDQGPERCCFCGSDEIGLVLDAALKTLACERCGATWSPAAVLEASSSGVPSEEEDAIRSALVSAVAGVPGWITDARAALAADPGAAPSSSAVEVLARRLAPVAFETTSGFGHAEFAEEDREVRERARDEARNFLSLATQPSDLKAQLLSDEVSEAAAKAEYDDWSELGEAERDECRAACRRGLEAVAETLQVTGEGTEGEEGTE